MGDVIVRFNSETGREEFWSASGWTTNGNHAVLMNPAEAKRIAREVGGKSEDADYIFGEE